MNKKTKIIIAVALVVGFSAGFFGYRKYFSSVPENEKPEVENTQSEQTNKPETPAVKPSSPAILTGFKLYKNADFGFEIQYPEKWTVSEESIENVWGENAKAFYFKKPNSDLRFAVLPRDGLSYGLPDDGISSKVFIGGISGVQQKWTLPDGRRLWLVHPQYGLYNWSQDIGRIDTLTSATDPAGDSGVFEQMLNSFKLSK